MEKEIFDRAVDMLRDGKQQETVILMEATTLGKGVSLAIRGLETADTWNLPKQPVPLGLSAVTALIWAAQMPPSPGTTKWNVCPETMP